MEGGLYWTVNPNTLAKFCKNLFDKIPHKFPYSDRSVFNHRICMVNIGTVDIPQQVSSSQYSWQLKQWCMSFLIWGYRRIDINSHGTRVGDVRLKQSRVHSEKKTKSQYHFDVSPCRTSDRPDYFLNASASKPEQQNENKQCRSKYVCIDMQNYAFSRRK